MAIGIFERLIRNGKRSYIKCESPFPLYGNSLFNVIEYNSGKSFETKGDISNEWWQISVDRYYISPNSYRIKTFNNDPGHTHLKSWNLSASNDNETWTIIDSQNNRADMNYPNITVQFNISNFETFFRFFRITLIESHNHNIPKRLSFSEFDVYGVILTSIFATRCAQTRMRVNFVYFVVLLTYK